MKFHSFGIQQASGLVETNQIDHQIGHDTMIFTHALRAEMQAFDAVQDCAVALAYHRVLSFDVGSLHLWEAYLGT